MIEKGVNKMDFQSFVDNIDMPCCVLSVEKRPDGKCGEIRIVVSNKPYKDVMGPSYYDNMPYYELVPQDNKFEEYCFRAAVMKQRMHAYVETKALHAWTDQTLIPLASDREDIGYCQFIFEFTETAETNRMATLSASAANSVIKAGLALLSADNFEKCVSQVLEDLMEESGANGAQVLLIDNATEKVINFCEILRQGVEAVHKPGEEAVTYSLIRTWENVIGVSNGLIIKDEQDMLLVEEKNPEWAYSMRSHCVRSLILIPLRRNKETVGYMYLVNFDTSRIVQVKETMELMSFILGSEIYNHILLHRLEELSMVDALTGLRNRRAMVDCMDQISAGEPESFGVINIDLNGLKTINDTGGHEAGDRILIQAGEILGKVFYQDDLFRTGGDEFIVIMRRIRKAVFDRKLERLHNDMEKNGDVSFAIGAFWSDGSVDVRTAFRLADDRMYEDKKTFYEKNMHLRRR